MGLYGRKRHSPGVGGIVTKNKNLFLIAQLETFYSSQVVSALLGEMKWV